MCLRTWTEKNGKHLFVATLKEDATKRLANCFVSLSVHGMRQAGPHYTASFSHTKGELRAIIVCLEADHNCAYFFRGWSLRCPLEDF